MKVFIRTFFRIFSVPIFVGICFCYLYYYALHHWLQPYLRRYELYRNYNFYDYLASFDIKATVYVGIYFLGIATGYKMINVFMKSAMKGTVMIASGFLFLMFWFIKLIVAVAFGPIFIIVAFVYVLYRSFKPKPSITVKT
ncbi:prominin family protein [Neobacillus mesonae]|uniref:prominin family protein n=1 Tax=Neobacillus mesonae TaxID=1193713 RepID=UPI002041CF6C|nr:prominin family protein [Neobacillus mesonae]MCM3571272.1 prominin family protein [Neobacillus mesonae]